MISEEQFRNDKMSFQMCEGIGSLLIKGNKKFSLHIVFATFFFHGYPSSRQKKMMLYCLKRYEIHPNAM